MTLRYEQEYQTYVGFRTCAFMKGYVMKHRALYGYEIC